MSTHMALLSERKGPRFREPHYLNVSTTSVHECLFQPFKYEPLDSTFPKSYEQPSAAVWQRMSGLFRRQGVTLVSMRLALATE